MTPDDDPLWYDRVEPDEPLGPTVWILMGAFGMVDLVRASTKTLIRTIRGRVAAAFNDAKLRYWHS